MHGNPRFLDWKILLLALLSLLWQRFKDWLNPSVGTPEAFAAQSAFLPDYLELCGVEATVYEAGTIMLGERLLQNSKDWLWWFEDSSIKRLEDALTSGMRDGYSVPDEFRTFKCRAIRFELTPMFNPAYVSRHSMSGCVSAMDVDISHGQEFARFLFEGDDTDSLQRMAQYALEHGSERDPILGIQFVGLFNVWYSVFYDDDGSADYWKVQAEFVRQFDMEKALAAR